MRRFLMFFFLSTCLICADTGWAKDGKRHDPKAKVEKHDAKATEHAHKRQEKTAEKARKREAKTLGHARKRAVHPRPVATTGVNAPMRFRGLDRNHDRVITRNEWRGNDVSFRVRDWNGDGVLSGNEIRPGAHWPVGFKPRFVGFDRNNDGVISRGEWRGKPKTFDRLDTNHDGVLSQAEFSRR